MSRNEFLQGLVQDGYAPAESKSLPIGYTAPDHTHPFDVRALITEGEMRLTVDGVETAYRPGEIFVMPAGRVHAEAVGPEGTTYLVGRRHGS